MLENFLRKSLEVDTLKKLKITGEVSVGWKA